MQFKRNALLLILILHGTVLYPQALKQSESMHESGKVYVFLGVVLIILIGLFVYLFMLDKKIKKLEKNK